MRILICRSCGDAIKLKSVAKWCECGKSGGAMVSQGRPVYWGETALAFKLNSLSLENLQSPPSNAWKENDIEAILIPNTEDAPQRVKCPLKLYPKIV